MKKLFLLVCLILSQSLVYGQQSNIDSLLRLLKKDKIDTSKVMHQSQLSREYTNIGNYDTAIIYANSALQLSNIILEGSTDSKINYAIKKYKAYSYNVIGNANKDQGDYSEALKNHLASLIIRKEIGDKKGEAVSYNNIGFTYYSQGNYPDALKNHFISLKICEAIGDKKGVSRSYNNIGNVYFNQKNYSEALKNHFSSLKIKNEIGDEEGTAHSLNNIGIVYFSQGNNPEALKKFLASLKIFEAIGSKINIAALYNNMGSIYKDQDSYLEALNSHFSSLKIEEEIGDKSGIVASYIGIAEVFAKQKKYLESKTYLIKACVLGKEIGHKEYLANVYHNLMRVDSARANFKGAYENHKLFISYEDSLNNEQTKEETIQMQMTYDFEKKEAISEAEHKKEIENQKELSEEKSRKQNLIIAFVAIGLALVLVFAAFIFRSLRVTRRQKHIIEQQKHLVEEHQKDIIDSITYAKRLQQAILPSADEIKKYIPDHFIFYKPKDIVAGDFYWMHVVDDLIFIAAADSTGHGVPGAMVSVVCSNALNRSVNEFNLRDTGKILDKTRDLVLETFAKSGEEIKDGMDISLLCINKAKKQIYWSGANNQLWYIQNSTVSPSMSVRAESRTENKLLHEIKANKQPIGKTDDPKPFTTHTIELNIGTVFYLMTDGYADQFGGPKGKKFKYKALEEKLVATRNLSLQQQNLELRTMFDDWKGNLEQVDDVTIIGVRI